MADPVIGQAATPDSTARTDTPVATEAVPQLPDFDTALTALSLDKNAPDYQEKLAKLRAHPLVAGVAGSIAETTRKTQDEASRIAAQEKAVRDREEELFRMIDEDPDKFLEISKSKGILERQQKELQELKDAEAARISGQIGQHVRDLPELQDLSLTEQRKIADALSKATGDDVLGVYQAVVLDIAADKRAAARMEAEFPARLEAEREAWATSTNASRLRSTAAPDLRTGAPAGAVSDEPDYRTNPVGYLDWVNNGGRKRGR